MADFTIDTSDFNFQEVFAKYRYRYDQLVAENELLYARKLPDHTREEIANALHTLFFTGIVYFPPSGTPPSSEDLIAHVAKLNSGLGAELEAELYGLPKGLTRNEKIRIVLAPHKEVIADVNRWLLGNGQSDSGNGHGDSGNGHGDSGSGHGNSDNAPGHTGNKPATPGKGHSAH